MTVHINVARQYSTHPLGRFKSAWTFSGERFREEFLQGPLNQGERVEVDLRGTRGLAPSFLEEAFGGLIDSGIAYERVEALLSVIADDAAREQQIWRYIKSAAGLADAS